MIFLQISVNLHICLSIINGQWRPYESACGSTDPVEAVSEYIEVQPKALKLVIERGKENIKRWKKHYEVDITVRTNDTDGQFAGRIHEQAGAD